LFSFSYESPVSQAMAWYRYKENAEATVLASRGLSESELTTNIDTYPISRFITENN